MTSVEKLAKILEQLKIQNTSSEESNSKKKEYQIYLCNLTETLCNGSLQGHKDFVNYIGPGIDMLLKFCDSPDSNVRLTTNEALNKVIKALLTIHSNRILVELCKQIKKNTSIRILKLALNHFGDLCHYIRPQKRRAYLANLLNAILHIAQRNEESLHESLATFMQKLFNVMGLFANENETKLLLKVFLANLSSDSTIIRRCAANSIAAIVVNNKKMSIVLTLVVEHVIDTIYLPQDNHPIKTSVIIGSLVTLRMLLPMFPADLSEMLKLQKIPATPSKTTPDLNTVITKRIVQLFELCLQYSLFPDHNVANAALETLQQLLKMPCVSEIPLFKSWIDLLGSRVSSNEISKASSEWSLAPLPVAEESHLLESDIVLPDLGNAEEYNQDGYNTNSNLLETEQIVFQLKEEPEEMNDQVTNDVVDSSDKSETSSIATTSLILDIGSLNETNNAFVYCGRHLAHHFLLTGEKNVLKSDRSIRVSLKNLALSCLTLVGTLEPEIWNMSLSRSSKDEGPLIIDVLEYISHGDPQLRGQTTVIACVILKNVARGFRLQTVEVERLFRVITEALKDSGSVSCRLALQGLQHSLPHLLESNLCYHTVPIFHSLLNLSSNTYWLVKVDLLELLSSVSWISLEFWLQKQGVSVVALQKEILRNILFKFIGDEDQRVRNAVANCFVGLAKNLIQLNNPIDILRLGKLADSPPQQNGCMFLNYPLICGVPITVNGLAKSYIDTPRQEEITENLTAIVHDLYEMLAASGSKLIKMGCLQSLATLSTTYPPAAYPEAYGCNCNESCGFLKIALTLMINSNYIFDLLVHQSLLTLCTQLFTGLVTWSLSSSLKGRDNKDLREFSNKNITWACSIYLNHVIRVLNAFCCALEDLNPISSMRGSLVTLPNPSSLSPIRRKLKSGESFVGEKEEKVEEVNKKWSKATQLLNPNNLGYFVNAPQYIKLYEVIKGNYATCKLNFDTATSERLSNFLRALLDALSTLLEVMCFQDIGKCSEEILGYLRLIFTVEAQSTLHCVQQLLKALFGVNLAAMWYEDITRHRAEDNSKLLAIDLENGKTFYQISCVSFNPHKFNQAKLKSNRKESIPRLSGGYSPEKLKSGPSITKFHTVGKLGPDKSALSSYIRLFEPMVIKALKLYTVTSNVDVQKQVLDLLCELIHLCVNYCLLDADQVFLTFVIQQFEFLEEGFIPKIEILLPSMFRFLSLLSYDRYHSKTIITIPRIIRLCGGLMATGKDAEIYVLPALEPIVHDVFLAKERLTDDVRELDTQKEVLISMLLRLIEHHKVYPMLNMVLNRSQQDSINKWIFLSKQICDVLVPCLYQLRMDLDSVLAVDLLLDLFSYLSPCAVHECLLGLLQMFASPETNAFHRVLAGRIIVAETFMGAFDEPFFLDCLSEFNLNYLINQVSDPLNVTAENTPPEMIISRVFAETLTAALIHLQSEQVKEQFTSDHCKCSLLEQLIFKYISVLYSWKTTDEFPVIRKSLEMEFASESFKKEISAIVIKLHNRNPLIFLRICSLFGEYSKQFFTEDNFQSGELNWEIVRKGLFLIECSRMNEKSENLADFFEINANIILDNAKEIPIQELIRNVLVDNPELFCSLLKGFQVKKKWEYSSISSLITLLNICEKFQYSLSSEALDRLILKTRYIPFGEVHRKVCDLIISKLESPDECTFETVTRLIGSIKHLGILKYYTKLEDRLHLKQPTTLQKPAIDKSFVLQLLTERKFIHREWRQVINILPVEDIHRYLNSPECLQHILTHCRVSRQDLFNYSKQFLFEKIATKPLERKRGLELGHLISSFLRSIPQSEIYKIFDETEIGILANLSLTLLTQICEIKTGFTSLLAFKQVARFSRNVIDEWMKNLPLVYSAVNCLISFMVWLRNGTPLSDLKSSGLENSKCDSSFVSCCTNLSKLVLVLETDLSLVPKEIRQPFKMLVTTLSRMPIFYSYICVPPAFWEKNWNPAFDLDIENHKLNLSDAPTHYLHDEIALKQFIFRIETFGWISRKTFEEIWMSILGVLNLKNETQTRPEEQACILQATCEALRALTIILQKNIRILQGEDPIHGEVSINSRCTTPVFLATERGQKLSEIYHLLKSDNRVLYPTVYETLLDPKSFAHIQYNLGIISENTWNVIHVKDNTDIDVQSCIHFLIDLYTQWLQNTNTPYVLLVAVFRSLYYLSNSFVEVQHFQWLLENSLNILKQLAPEDPPVLESILIACTLKAVAFIDMDNEIWETVKRLCENSLSSQHIACRASVLRGILYLLQRFSTNPDPIRSTTIVTIVMDYVYKYFGSENAGPDWHQLLLWTVAFYCAEHFTNLTFRTNSVLDYVIRSALNGIIESFKISIPIQHEILEGLERLCLMKPIPGMLRKLINKEIINIIRNVERHSLFTSALKTLLAIVYTDSLNQPYKPGSDPETMLIAMEWVGALFQRMKKGADCEVDLLSRIMPVLICDIFPPADILNRLLAEFISASPSVAAGLTPTIFKVFEAARSLGDESLVLEWILLSLPNFTRISYGDVAMATWNILCFFVAASTNQWLQSVFPFIHRPMKEKDPFERQIFVMATLDFQSQLNTKQREMLSSTFLSAREVHHLFADVCDVLELK